MSLKATVRKWASNYLYSAGAKAGEPTKVDPSAVAANGLVPGSNVGAEDMNDVLNALTAEVRRMRLLPLMGQWDVLHSGNAAGAGIVAARSKSGYGYVEAGSSGVDLKLVRTAVLDASEVISSPSVNVTFVADMVRAKHLLYILGGDGANASGWRLNAAIHDGNTDVTSTLGNPTGPFGIRGAFDAVTGRIGVSLDDGGADQTFGTIAASGATIVAATTAPTVDNSGDDHLMAAGNGIVMAISLDNGGTPWCVTSADGGVNWTEVTAPAGDVLHGLGYTDDFCGEGPMFIAHTGTGNTSWDVYKSADGASWTAAFSSAEFNAALGGTQKAGRSFLLGDFLVVFHFGIDDDNPTLQEQSMGIVDLSRTTEGIRVGLGPTVDSVYGAAFDGSRFYIVCDENTAQQVYASPPIAPFPLYVSAQDDFS